MKALKWIDDLIGLPELQKRKLAYKIETVPIEEIDLDYDNMGRILDRVDQNRVTEYAVKMLDGAAFPRVILNRWKGKGKLRYRIVSGNHRTCASKEAGFDQVEAYVIEVTDEYILETLPMALNISHGKNVVSDELLAQAKRVIDVHGIEPAQAAKDLGIPKVTLNEYIRAHKAIDRLQSLGVHNGVKLQRATLVQLSKIQNDHSLKKIGDVLTRFRVEVSKAKEAIDRLNRQTTEAAQLDAIDKFEHQLRQEQRPREQGIRLTVRSKTFRLMNSLANHLAKFTTLKKLQLTDLEDQNAARDKLAEILAAAESIFGLAKGKKRISA